MCVFFPLFALLYVYQCEYFIHLSGGTNVGRVIGHADGFADNVDGSDNHVTNGGSVVEYEDGVSDNVDVSENDFQKEFTKLNTWFPLLLSASRVYYLFFRML